MTSPTYGPSDLTIVVPLASPELRRALQAVAAAFAEADAACGPPAPTHSGKAAGKPGSRPPAGNHAAIELCRRLAREGERDGDGNPRGRIVREVEDMLRGLSPAERKAASEWRRQVREMRAREREATATGLRHVYVADGKMRARREPA